MQVRSDMYLLTGMLSSRYKLDPTCICYLACCQEDKQIQVRSDMYPMSSWCKLDPTCSSYPACISCQADTSKIWQVSVVLLMQVRSDMCHVVKQTCIWCPADASYIRHMFQLYCMYQLSRRCKLDPTCISYPACISYSTCITVKLMQVRSDMYLLFGRCKLDPTCISYPACISCQADTS